jgi:hypothetical protein
LNKPWGRLFTGASVNWNYLTSKVEQNDGTIRDPSDYSGYGAGVLLGYRYQFNSGLGIFLQGNADFIWLDVENSNDAKPLYSGGVGISKAF